VDRLGDQGLARLRHRPAQKPLADHALRLWTTGFDRDPDPARLAGGAEHLDPLTEMEHAQPGIGRDLGGRAQIQGFGIDEHQHDGLS
jgi:hypothetical protein